MKNQVSILILAVATLASANQDLNERNFQLTQNAVAGAAVPQQQMVQPFFPTFGWGRRFSEDLMAKEFMTLDIKADEKSTKTIFKIVADVLPRLFKLLTKLGPKDEDKRMFEEINILTRNFAEGWHLHLDQSQLEMISKELFALIDKITKSPIKAEIKLSGL
uniref:DUF148 domain-containing protein n=1 Tax=Rhabditophanes sp. KR3021 TaxID=114890 RepID=A0AC35TSF0_9BILA